MKNKLITVSIILMFLFTSLISVEAIAPTPRVDLDEYQIESTSKDNVYVTGTVTLAKGQYVGVYNADGSILYNVVPLPNSNDEEDFKLQIPARYLNEGNNTFKVKSLPLKGIINSSNPKTVTVKIKTVVPKKDQTITASNISLTVGGIKNIGAKTSSGLILYYSSADPNIVTVDSTGNLIGRKAGTTKVTILQPGNDEYNPATKVITVTVNNPPETSYTFSWTINDTSLGSVIQSYDSSAINKASGSVKYVASDTQEIRTVSILANSNAVIEKVLINGKEETSFANKTAATYVLKSGDVKMQVYFKKVATTKKDQTITASDLSLKVGESKNLNAKASSGLKLYYISQNPKVASVDDNGKVTGKKVGTTKIIITQPGNNTYKQANKQVTIKVVEATKGTYTVVFNPNGGKGSAYNQKIEVDKSTKLIANKFTRDGYTFVGWATASGKQVISGTDVTKFKNVNMNHFQLGKVSYKNKASVKNLAKKNKQIVLYAVWKGNGPQAAVDWAKLIAADNNFCYNTTFSGPWGCYFCKDNKNWHNKKHYVCMTLVNAAYAHGANQSAWWSKNGTCNTTYIDGDARLSKIRKCKALKEVGKPAMKNLKPGDIFVWNKHHVAMYVGKVNGKYKFVEATRGSKPYTTTAHRNSQIHVIELKSSKYKGISSVFRLK